MAPCRALCNSARAWADPIGSVRSHTLSRADSGSELGCRRLRERALASPSDRSPSRPGAGSTGAVAAAPAGRLLRPGSGSGRAAPTVGLGRCDCSPERTAMGDLVRPRVVVVGVIGSGGSEYRLGVCGTGLRPVTPVVLLAEELATGLADPVLLRDAGSSTVSSRSRLVPVVCSPGSGSASCPRASM